MDSIEALMQATSSDHNLFAIPANGLGKWINTVKSPISGCPFCHAGKTTMTVHEFGVQWPCGCARVLDPIHRSPDERSRCTKCNPRQANVIPIQRKNQTKPGSSRRKSAVEELLAEYPVLSSTRKAK